MPLNRGCFFVCLLACPSALACAKSECESCLCDKLACRGLTSPRTRDRYVSLPFPHQLCCLFVSARACVCLFATRLGTAVEGGPAARGRVARPNAGGGTLRRPGLEPGAAGAARRAVRRGGAVQRSAGRHQDRRSSVAQAGAGAPRRHQQAARAGAGAGRPAGRRSWRAQALAGGQGSGSKEVAMGHGNGGSEPDLGPRPA